MEGANIVDLAAGASSLTAGLLESGANAFALDRLYYDLSNLEEQTEASLQQVLQDTARIAPNYLEHMERVTRESIRRFFESLVNNPDRYKAGWLTHLPFESEFFDWTVSLNSISDLAIDYDVFLAAMEEAIRITGGGGKVVIAPFHTSSGRHNYYATEHAQLLAYLQEKYPYKLLVESEIPNYLDSRLTIVIERAKH